MKPNQQIEDLKAAAKTFAADSLGNAGVSNMFARMNKANDIVRGARMAWQWKEIKDDKLDLPRSGFEYLCFHPDYISTNNPNGVLQLLYRSDGAFSDRTGHACIKPTHWQPVPPNPIQLNDLK